MEGQFRCSFLARMILQGLWSFSSLKEIFCLSCALCTNKFIKAYVRPISFKLTSWLFSCYYPGSKWSRLSHFLRDSFLLSTWSARNLVSFEAWKKQKRKFTYVSSFLAQVMGEIFFTEFHASPIFLLLHKLNMPTLGFSWG